MTAKYISLARPVVQSMQAYQPGKPIEEAQRELGIEAFIKLASNENPRGPSARVQQTIAASAADINRYPDANGFYLKQVLAERCGVEAQCITLGCGSNDVLELIASAYLDSDLSAIYSQYGFLVYGLAVARSGAKPIVVDARDFGHDLAAMGQAVQDNTRVIYIANPNNPTGTYATESELIALLDSVSSDVLVVLDEAYFEYIDAADYPNGLGLLKRYANLIVTRSFSKAYGLGGMRVGYAVSNPDVADVLNRVRQPFNVSAVALAAAQAAVEDEQYLSESVRLNRAGMQQLEAGLNTLGIDYIPSVANFITLRAPGSAQQLNQQLLQSGIIVRPVANYAMDDYLRVSIGLEQENSQFLQVLGQLLDQ